MKKILIVGSEGFIGKACVKHFAAEFDVTGCDVVDANGSHSYHKIVSAADFRRIFESGFDVCINASGSAHVGFSFENPEKDRELNVKNVEQLLEAIRRNSPQCRFINFSSAAVYGNPKTLPVSEDAAPAPLSPYGKHKLESETLLKNAAEKDQLRTCSLRVFSAYGPGLRKQLFWDIFQKSRTNKTVKLFGSGNESRDFIFIGDLVKAIDCVIHKAEFKGEVYNVAAGVETSIREAAELFLSALPGNCSVEFSGEVKSGDPLNWRADISRLKKLGFVPATSLAEGFRLTAQAYCASPQVV